MELLVLYYTPIVAEQMLISESQSTRGTPEDAVGHGQRDL